MYATRFYDQVARLIDDGLGGKVAPLVAGNLYALKSDPESWPDARETFRNHPLCSKLLLDPYCAHSARRPRGYAGDADLIDMIYTRRPPAGGTPAGLDLFATSIEFQASEGVRKRRDFAESELLKAHKAGKRILSLACGHFREGTLLIGQDLGNITVVDQDQLSLDVVRADHGHRLNCVEANVIRFLKSAALRGEQWDYIYTLGLTDYFDERAMALFHKLLKPCLAPDGHILLANFVPDHLAVGWMDAVMDWQLICRTEQDLENHARAVGFTPRTWRDETDSIAYCEMKF